MKVFYLIAAQAARSDALAVMASAHQGSFLPKVNEVHQRLSTLAAREAGGMPESDVACPVRIHHGPVPSGPLSTAAAVLRDTRTA